MDTSGPAPKLKPKSGADDSNMPNFMADLGLINVGSLGTNLWLMPAVVTGVFIGRKLVARLNQRWFENLSLALAVAAGMKLLF